MSTKRILTWEDDDWNWSVRTRCGDLSVVRDDEHNEWLAKWIYVDDDDTIGRYPDAESAIDACESAYLARCSEFLRVAGPGECVVKVEDAKLCQDQIRCRQSDLLVEQPVSEMVWAELEFTTGLLNRLTAAIDAAGGGK